MTIRELAEVERANASGRRAVVFIHGLWLLASSWDAWRDVFEQAGLPAVRASWPGDPDTVAGAREHPEAFAGQRVRAAADHIASLIAALKTKPAIVGHSFGGTLTQMLAGRGLAAVSVAIDPAPFRGVLPVPASALKAASPVLRNPANRGRGVMLTYEQFRYAFANAVDDAEARRLYSEHAVPAPGRPIFQAAFANLNPGTDVRVDTRNPHRGPLLIIEGDRDNTVPWAIADAAYRLQRRNPGVTEIVKVPGRGHSLTFDSGWREVAEIALGFVRRFAA